MMRRFALRFFHLLPLILLVPPLLFGLCTLVFRLFGPPSFSSNSVRVWRYASQALALNRTIQSVQDQLDLRNQEIDWTSLTAASQYHQPKPEPAASVREDLPINLQGIAWDKGQPVAFLNDKIYSLNDEIEGFRVSKITENAVELVDGAGKDRTLRLYENLASEPQGEKSATP